MYSSVSKLSPFIWGGVAMLKWRNYRNRQVARTVGYFLCFFLKGRRSLRNAGGKKIRHVFCHENQRARSRATISAFNLMNGKQSCGGKMRGQDRQKRKRKSAWEQQELKQALQLSKIEAWRDDLRLAGTNRSAKLCSSTPTLSCSCCPRSANSKSSRRRSISCVEARALLELGPSFCWGPALEGPTSPSSLFFDAGQGRRD